MLCYRLFITDLNIPKTSLSKIKVTNALIRILSPILVSYAHFRRGNHWLCVIQTHSVSFVDINVLFCCRENIVRKEMMQWLSEPWIVTHKKGECKEPPTINREGYTERENALLFICELCTLPFPLNYRVFSAKLFSLHCTDHVEHNINNTAVLLLIGITYYVYRKKNRDHKHIV